MRGRRVVVVLALAGLAYTWVEPRPVFAEGGCSFASFAASDLPKAIPDPGTAESSISVSAGGWVSSVEAHVNVTHPFDSDLKFELVSPSGKTVTLAEAVGTWGHDFADTVFDDAAASSIISELPPFTGTFRPAEPLSAFVGTPRGGTWKLRVTDLRARYAGQLVSWGIDVTSCAKQPAAVRQPVGAPDLPPLPTGVPTSYIPVEGTLVTVTTNTDVEDGDVSSVAHLLVSPGPDGKISLREAMEATNNDPGTYTIRFAPALLGTSIDISSPQPGYLPPLRGRGVLIDGDIDGDGKPDVTITNHLTDQAGTGLVILSSANRVHALALKGFPFGILLTSPCCGPLPVHQTYAQNIVSGVEVTTNDLSGNGFVSGISLNPIWGHPECNSSSSCETHNTWADIRLIGNRIDSPGIAIDADLRPIIGDTLQRFTVAGNFTHSGQPDSRTGNPSAIGLSAGYQAGSDDNRVSDALIAHNTMEVEGTAYAMIITAGGGGGSSNVIEDLGIISNRVQITGVVTKPDSARGVSFGVADGCGGGTLEFPGCIHDDVLRRVRLVGNIFAGSDDAAILVEDPCCGTYLHNNRAEDLTISENLIQGIVPPNKLNPRGIVLGGHTNISNVVIDSNTIEQETVDPQTSHVADLAGAGILVVGGLGGGSTSGDYTSIENVSVSNNRIETDLTGIALIGGGPSDENPFPNGDYQNDFGNVVSGVQLSGNVISRAPVLATRWDANAKGISVIGGFSAQAPNGDWSTTTGCSVTDVTLFGNNVAGVVNDVWVISNVGQGASGNTVSDVRISNRSSFLPVAIPAPVPVRRPPP